MPSRRAGRRLAQSGHPGPVRAAGPRVRQRHPVPAPELAPSVPVHHGGRPRRRQGPQGLPRRRPGDALREAQVHRRRGTLPQARRGLRDARRPGPRRKRSRRRAPRQGGARPAVRRHRPRLAGRGAGIRMRDDRSALAPLRRARTSAARASRTNLTVRTGRATIRRSQRQHPNPSTTGVAPFRLVCLDSPVDLREGPTLRRPSRRRRAGGGRTVSGLAARGRK